MKASSVLVFVIILFSGFSIPIAPARADGFTYETNNGALTITDFLGYGVIAIPPVKDGMPVTSIGDWAFSYSQAVSFLIPNTITNIGKYAFAMCTAITNLSIPDSVTSIGGYAFDNCDKVKEFNLSTGLALIPEHAFDRCYGLVNITIPAGVVMVERSVFTDCTNLAGVYFEGDAPAAGLAVFQNAPATVYYLPGRAGWGETFNGQPTAVWRPRLQAANSQAGQFGFDIFWGRGTTLVVESSPTSGNVAWAPIATVTLTPGSYFFSDPESTTYRSRIYRVRWP